MNRRSFLRALGLAPLAVPVVAAIKPAEASRVGKALAFDMNGDPTMIVGAQKAADPPLVGLDHLDGEDVVVWAQSRPTITRTFS